MSVRSEVAIFETIAEKRGKFARVEYEVELDDESLLIRQKRNPCDVLFFSVSDNWPQSLVNRFVFWASKGLSYVRVILKESVRKFVALGDYAFIANYFSDLETDGVKIHSVEITPYLDCFVLDCFCCDDIQVVIQVMCESDYNSEQVDEELSRGLGRM